MISVIIPSYNRFELLNRAINSVTSQSFENYEIIVIDDFSSDLRYLELEKDERIIYKRLERRLGFPGKVRNEGIKLSKGDWIAFLDDDDFWLPNKLKKQNIFLKDYDFVCSDALINGISYSKNLYYDYWKMANPNDVNELTFEMVSKHNILINSTVILKKKLLETINGINETVRNGEDHLTWLSILKNDVVCYYVDEPLIDYNTNTYKHYTDELT